MLKPQHAEKNLINFRRCQECRLVSLARWGALSLRLCVPHPRDMQAAREVAATYSDDGEEYEDGDARNETSDAARRLITSN